MVEARGLAKHYGATLAVQDVSLTVQCGRVYGVLGPNGSGKSTTVRMLLGLIRPDKGEVRLFGEPLRSGGHRLLRHVGAVVETPAFIPYLSGRDNLRLLAKYIPGPTDSAISQILDRVHLAEAANRRFKNYSLGMKQRLGIAAAILHNPDLIILDEPTNGLDPQGTREVRQLIPELAAEGRTVMLCSHLLHEVEQVCDAVAIFQNGRVIAQGDTGQLIGGRSQLEVRAADAALVARLLATSPWAGRLSSVDGALRIEGAAADGEAVNRWLAAHDCFASTIHPVSQGLEDVFFELTGNAHE